MGDIPSWNIPGTNLRTPTFGDADQKARETAAALQRDLEEAERKAREAAAALQRELDEKTAMAKGAASAAIIVLDETKNEVVADWSNGPPDGYKIAGNTGKGKTHPTYAVDSDTLCRTEVLRDYKIDGHAVALDMRGDSRLEALKEYAQKLPDDPEIAKLTGEAREKAITDKLMAKVSETYGSYSDETLKHGNKAERDAKGTLWDDKSKLKDMEKDSFVCRHFAPVMSVLLNKAGVPNDLVSANMSPSAKLGEDGKFHLAQNKDGTDNSGGYHNFIVTKYAVVEATTDVTKGKSAYNSIVNLNKEGKTVTVDDVVFRGDALVVKDHTMYGGHTGDGDCKKENILKGQRASIERYNDQLEKEQAERKRAPEVLVNSQLRNHDGSVLTRHQMADLVTNVGPSGNGETNGVTLNGAAVTREAIAQNPALKSALSDIFYEERDRVSDALKTERKNAGVEKLSPEREAATLAEWKRFDVPNCNILRDPVFNTPKEKQQGAMLTGTGTNVASADTRTLTGTRSAGSETGGAANDEHGNNVALLGNPVAKPAPALVRVQQFAVGAASEAASYAANVGGGGGGVENAGGRVA